MTRIGFILLLSLALAGCRRGTGSDATPTIAATSATPAAPPAAASNAGLPYSLVPPGWTLDGWDMSSDGKYVVIGISGRSHGPPCHNTWRHG
ncbi:MAG: hypothetical protein HY873_11795 [Chloroflexi bacterium]|nr:hypothetical protein [Chloroflexota bacterium]